MKIDIADAVKNEGEVFNKVFDGPLQSIDFMGEHFSFPVVHVEAEYRFDGEGVAVEGNLSTQTEVNCSRCLKAFKHPVSFGFSEYFSKHPEPDEGVYGFAGEAIDLDTMLEDNIIMSLPMRFLCGEDCKGLCGVCGKNLNEGECGCDRDPVDSALSALSGFNKDNEAPGKS